MKTLISLSLHQGYGFYSSLDAVKRNQGFPSKDKLQDEQGLHLWNENLDFASLHQGYS